MTASRWALLGFLAFLAVAPFALSEFYVTLLNYVGLYSIVALGLVLLTGVGGFTSFGQAAFVGIGAYATGVLSTTYGMSPWLGLVLAVVLTAVAAFALALLTLRLSGHYLILGTIAWSISIYYVFGNVEGLGGYNGITRIPPLSLFGVAIDTARANYFLIWLVALLTILSIVNLLNSRTGRAIRALRSPVLAESFGVSTVVLKAKLFVYAAILAAIAGWLHAHYLRFINPAPFSINASFEYVFMIVVGGAASVWGAIVGAIAITALKTGLQDVMTRIAGSSAQYELIVFGLMIAVLLQRARGGLVPFVARYFPARALALPGAETPRLARRPRPARGEALLQVDQAQKNFGGLVAVNRVSFTLSAGEILGLIGPNGAGKSTLFNLITGVLPLSGGHVMLHGRKIDGLPSRQIVRSGVARTFQHVQLRHGMSTLENVALGAHIRGQGGAVAGALHVERAEEARLLHEAARQLDRVGLGDSLHVAADSLPLGKQRLVEIARALCADPVLLLLDEPAAGLRHQEKQALADLLRGLRDEGTSVLLVEHDMEFVMDLVDRIVVVDFGQKIAEGTPEAIQNDPKVIEAYLGGGAA